MNTQQFVFVLLKFHTQTCVKLIEKSPVLLVNWPNGLFSGSEALNQVEPQLQQFFGPLFPYKKKETVFGKSIPPTPLW